MVDIRGRTPYSLLEGSSTSPSATTRQPKKKVIESLDLCVSSLRRGHANLLCINSTLIDALGRGPELKILICLKLNIGPSDLFQNFSFI